MTIQEKRQQEKELRKRYREKAEEIAPTLTYMLEYKISVTPLAPIQIVEAGAFIEVQLFIPKEAL